MPPIICGQSDLRSASSRPEPGRAFTLIELLMVISIIGLLMAILLPALGKARIAAKSALTLSNMRQIGMALAAYRSDRDGYYPIHSSEIPKIAGTKPRWPDYLHPYVRNTQVYTSPNLDEREIVEFTKVFWHEVSSTPAEVAVLNGRGIPLDPAPDASDTYGGYGYNFQYLGNARASKGVLFNAHENDITHPSVTVVIGDTAGSRDGLASHEPGDGSAAVYALDPPLGSTRGSGKGSYYEGGGDENLSPYDPGFKYLWRSFTAHRNNGAAAFSFTDGHGDLKKRSQIDDFDGNDVADNGYWNGEGDPNGDPY